MASVPCFLPQERGCTSHPQSCPVWGPDLFQINPTGPCPLPAPIWLWAPHSRAQGPFLWDQRKDRRAEAAGSPPQRSWVGGGLGRPLLRLVSWRLLGGGPRSPVWPLTLWHSREGAAASSGREGGVASSSASGLPDALPWRGHRRPGLPSRAGVPTTVSHRLLLQRFPQGQTLDGSALNATGPP